MQDESRLSKLHESWKKVEKFRDLKSPLEISSTVDLI